MRFAQATDLKAVDTFGRNDVFVRVRVGGAEQQTPTLDGCGAHAVWGGAEEGDGGGGGAAATGAPLTVAVSVPRAEFPPKEVEIVAYHLRNMMIRTRKT
eukprot:COSAG01_NODE_1404_length_10443_cov_29.217517_13_plen_99_part_00